MKIIKKFITYDITVACLFGDHKISFVVDCSKNSIVKMKTNCVCDPEKTKKSLVFLGADVTEKETCEHYINKIKSCSKGETLNLYVKEFAFLRPYLQSAEALNKKRLFLKSDDIKLEPIFYTQDRHLNSLSKYGNVISRIALLNSIPDSIGFKKYACNCITYKDGKFCIFEPSYAFIYTCWGKKYYAIDGYNDDRMASKNLQKMLEKWIGFLIEILNGDAQRCEFSRSKSGWLNVKLKRKKKRNANRRKKEIGKNNC